MENKKDQKSASLNWGNVMNLKTIALIVILAITCYSRPVFVDVNYDEQSGGASDGSFEKPFTTLSLAYGDIIEDIKDSNNVESGVYYATEPYYINILNDTLEFTSEFELTDTWQSDEVDFTESNNLTIQSYYQEYDKRCLMYSHTASVDQMMKLKVSHVIFNMLKCIGGSDVENVIYVKKAGLEDVAIENCVFSFATTFDGNNDSITGSAIRTYYGEYDASDIKLINNIFIGTESKNGTGLYCNTGDVKIVNNTFYRMSLGLRIDDSNVGNAVIKNNSIISMHYALVEIAGTSTGTITIDHCLRYDVQGANDFVINYSSVEYIDTLWRDPKLSSIDIFSDKVGTILSTSACIDNGDGDALVGTSDFYTLSRNSTPDIGAVEYNGNFAVNDEKKIYVDVDHVGTSDGSSDNPYKSIQDAFDAIPGGLAMRPYTLLLEKNTTNSYTGFEGDLHCNFNEDNPLTIKSADFSDRVEISGQNSIFDLNYLRYVNIEGIIFKGISDTTGNLAITGASQSNIGKTDNINVRQCKFINTDDDHLGGIYGLGNNMVVENCLFYSEFNNDSVRAINQASYGGLNYTLANNTVVGNWRYFITMSGANGLTGSKFINNVIHFSGDVGEIGYFYSGYYDLEIEDSNYVHGTEDENKTTAPGIETDNSSADFGKATSSSSPIIDQGVVIKETPRDDYIEKYDALLSRDMGAYEYDGFNYKDAAYFSRNQSGNVIAEYDKDNDITYTNIYGVGLIGKEVYDTDNQYSESYYYIKDHLGSTRKVYGSSDTLASKIQYYAYGQLNETFKGMSIDATETFTGKMLDSDGAGDSLGINGLGIRVYYFGARYYDPEIAQWLSHDPESQFWGPYTYAGNHANPVIMVDKDGKIIGLIVLGVAAGIGAYSGYKIGKAAGATGAELFMYGVLGAGIGLAGAGVGAAAIAGAGMGTATLSTAIASGVVGGMAGGATTGLGYGIMTSVALDYNFEQAFAYTMMSMSLGAVSGAVMGGVAGGVGYGIGKGIQALKGPKTAAPVGQEVGQKATEQATDVGKESILDIGKQHIAEMVPPAQAAEAVAPQIDVPRPTNPVPQTPTPGLQVSSTPTAAPTTTLGGVELGQSAVQQSITNIPSGNVYAPGVTPNIDYTVINVIQGGNQQIIFLFGM